MASTLISELMIPKELRSDTALKAYASPLSAAVGRAVFDRELRFVEVDATLAAIHGRPVEEHPGRQLVEILPTLAPLIAPLLRQVIATGQPILAVDVAGDLNGHPGHWLVSYFPVRTWAGSVLGVECLVRKISEPHEDLAATLTALQVAVDQAAFQAAVLDRLNDAVFAVDADERVTYWGAGAELLYGYSAEEVLGRPIGEVTNFAWLSPSDEVSAREALLTTGMWRGEQLHRHRNGATLQVEVALSRFSETQGRLAGRIAVVRDVSARRQTEAERERLLAEAQAARAQAEQAVRTRDDFFTLISHDLRNPLTVILTQARLLTRRLEQPAERLAYGLALIEGAAAQLDAQIKDLVDLARLDSGTPLSLDRVPVNLVAIARNVAESAQATTTRHRLRLETNGRDELICVCDGARIRRAVANLVMNAIAYSPDGGEIVTCVAPADGAADSWALISIQDRGIGIPAADLPHIFERFRRGANVPEHSCGTGLGLTSVDHIVAQHCGQVRVESIEGQGSTFTILLPLNATGPQ
jgi:PAS domain S-box-containing protein